MTNKEQLQRVNVVPPKLMTIFGPFEDDRESFIAMHNPHLQLVAFKVKPSKKISVKPRYGFIRSKGEILIKVKAPGLEKDEKPSTREKIRITFKLIPKDEAPKGPKDPWKEKTPENELDNRKLLVAFKEADETASKDAQDDDDSMSMSLSDGSDKTPPKKIATKKK